MDAGTGNRTFLAPTFGTPSPSGLIAFSDKTQGITEIRKLDGTLVTTVRNGGAVTSISPDGKRVAWLVDQGVYNTSSEVDRVVNLTTANIDGSNQKSLVTLEASAIHWLPDSRHVVALARAPGGTQSGIWSIDTSSGTNGVVVPATYVSGLTLSPDGSRMAYMITFSGDASRDGVWVANTNGTDPVHLREVGAFRWGADSSHLWFLKLAPSGGGEDHVLKVDVATDRVIATTGIGGRVLNDQWQISPSGNVVAYWNESDQKVYLKALVP